MLSIFSELGILLGLFFVSFIGFVVCHNFTRLIACPKRLSSGGLR